MARLKKLGTNITIELSDGFLIGRSLECNHVIEDTSISRNHCVFTGQAGDWYITDLSANGIFINAIKICQKTLKPLKEHDNIRMGSYAFEFREAPDPLVPQYDNIEIITIDDSFDEAFNQPSAAVKEQLAVPVQPIAPAPSAAAGIRKTEENIAFEQELTFSICTELFINAVTINCEHTFCKLCIYTWRKKSSNCPICRKTISTETPCMAVNNLVSLVNSRKCQEEQNARAVVVAAQEAEYKIQTQPVTLVIRGGRAPGRTHQPRGRAAASGLRLIDRMNERMPFLLEVIKNRQ